MFSTKGQDLKETANVKYLQAGVVYAHIYDAKLRTTNNGEKKSLEITLEAKAAPDFEGYSISKDDPEGPKFKGPSARISATVYTDQFNETNPMKNEIMLKLTTIAIAAGLRSEIDDIRAGTIDEWVAKAVDVLTGHYLYFFLKGTEDEYNGKTNIKLSLPKYKYVSADESKLDKFDKTNQYHFKALPKKAINSFEPPVNNDFDI